MMLMMVMMGIDSEQDLETVDICGRRSRLCWGVCHDSNWSN
jgi:hypothetical protein